MIPTVSPAMRSKEKYSFLYLYNESESIGTYLGNQLVMGKY